MTFTSKHTHTHTYITHTHYSVGHTNWYYSSCRHTPDYSYRCDGRDVLHTDRDFRKGCSGSPLRLMDGIKVSE